MFGGGWRGGRGRDRFPVRNIGEGAVPVALPSRTPEELARPRINWRRLDRVTGCALRLGFIGRQYNVVLYEAPPNAQRVTLEAIGIDYDNPAAWGAVRFALLVGDVPARIWLQQHCHQLITEVGAGPQFQPLPAFTPGHEAAFLSPIEDPQPVEIDLPPAIVLVARFLVESGTVESLTNFQTANVRLRTIIREDS